MSTVKFALPQLAASAVFLGFLAGLAVAEDKTPEVIRADYEGTLGSSRIQMTLIVHQGKLIPPSHYFYQKDLTDIPLSGTAGTTLALTEPGGGTFSLKFKGNGSNGNRPLTFDDSVGLVGTWTGKDGNTYPVALGALFAGAAPAEPPNSGCHCPE
jgi:hypothetical protein